MNVLFKNHYVHEDRLSIDRIPA